MRSQFLPVFGIDRICKSDDSIYNPSVVNNPADCWLFLHHKYSIFHVYVVHTRRETRVRCGYTRQSA
ncbi:hypothetical protein Q5687_27175, partial [Microcoleus sp. AT10_D2]|uniref:hypothetical protein n=1 Tax=Microcoleus sp. AT10_D2 TaxID=3055286 RepID=UPI002FD270A1